MGLVEFEDVVVQRGGRVIVGPLSFAVAEGETVVLLGRSGSGKTTTLRLVNALLRPSAGEVRVEDKPTTAWDPVRLRRAVGYVIQDVGLFPHFTVQRNVAVVPWLEGWPRFRVDDRVRELLDLVGLPEDRYGARYPHQLSGGQRQRVGVARALAGDPPILLCDEPFGALDPITRVELQQEFASLEGRLRKTVLFVTHDIREALRLGDRIVLMEDGAVRFDGSPDTFRATDDPLIAEFRSAL